MKTTKRKDAEDNRHIWPNKPHDRAILRKAERMTTQKRKETKNPKAKVSYTNVVEWMAEQLLGTEDREFGKYLNAKEEMENLIRD